MALPSPSLTSWAGASPMSCPSRPSSTQTIQRYGNRSGCGVTGPQPDVNYFAMVAVDPNVSVRVAFVQLLGDCMRLLTDRFDYEGRLAPYLLNCCLDDVEEVRVAALSAFDAIGMQYEVDKKQDLKCAGAVGCNRDSRRDFLEYGQVSPAEQHALERWGAIGPSFIHPFNARCRLGTRHFIRNQFKCAMDVAVMCDARQRPHGCAES